MHCRAVKILCSEGPVRVLELVQLGADCYSWKFLVIFTEAH